MTNMNCIIERNGIEIEVEVYATFDKSIGWEIDVIDGPDNLGDLTYDEQRSIADQIEDYYYSMY
jgi:hypothetical protein